MMIQKIEREDITYAILIRASHTEDGINYVSPEDYPQQLGYMKWPEGHCIEAHEHKLRDRQIERTQETIFVRSGRVNVKVFDDKKSLIEEVVITSGDVILFAAGGHSFKMLEETEMVAVKQGPYLGVKEDKTRFKPEG